VCARDPQIEFGHRNRPDVSLGVFETLLVRDGRPLRAGRHLERLAASVRALYAAALDPGLGEQVDGLAAGQGLARLRIEAVPDVAAPTRVRVALTIRAIDPAIVGPDSEVTLITVRVTGGAGPHKLVDRVWLERIEGAAGDGNRALLVSGTGELLETTRANVFLLRDGVLTTPPLDGAILGGVVRAAVLEQAVELAIPAREAPLTLEDLEQADAVLLSGSLRLLERARIRGGRRSADALSRLAGALDVDRRA
jgi:para-aminobenzoate synthetase / 4-amino-4-deoxychorismate lyase